MRKVLFGLLWFIVLYLAGAMIMGLVVGLEHRHESRAVVEAAATATVTKYATVLLLGSAALAAIGAYLGFLPGTRKKKPAEFVEVK